jgi:hypothetical protein
MKATDYIWIGVIPDIFGYGISVASYTREGAINALRKRWKEWMATSSFPKTDTFTEHFERFGGHVTKVSVDKAYYENFGE